MNKTCTQIKTRRKKEHQAAVCQKRGHKKTKKCDPSHDESITGNEAAVLEVHHEACGTVPEPHPCSQETVMCFSQEHDLHREVRWDYQSPETTKKLKRRRGLYTSDDVKQLVANFDGDDDDDDEVEAGNFLLNSGKIYLPTKSEVSLSRNGRLRKAKEKSTRWQQQKFQRDSVQEMIRLLQDKTDKKTDMNSRCERLSPTSHLSKGCDMFVNACCDENYNDGYSDCWSDEDFFKDNSFIIEATQNPEKFLKSSQNLVSESTEVTLESAMFSRKPAITKTFLDESSVIPPTCVIKQPLIRQVKGSVPSDSLAKIINNFQTSHKSAKYSNGIVARTVSTRSTNRNNNTCTTSTTNSVRNFKPTGTVTAKPNNIDLTQPTAASTSSSNNNNYTSVVNKSRSQSSQTVIVNPPPGAKYKTSFRKFNTFEADGPANGTRSIRAGEAKEARLSCLNRSFRKTLSFDNSLSRDRSSGQLCTTNRPLAADFTKYPAKTNASSTAVSLKNGQNGAVKPRPACSTSVRPNLKLEGTVQNSANEHKTELDQQPGSFIVVADNQSDGFDVSLPDDVFQKLLEVDEILATQSGTVATAGTNTVLGLCDEAALLPRAPSYAASGTNTVLGLCDEAALLPRATSGAPSGTSTLTSCKSVSKDEVRTPVSCRDSGPAVAYSTMSCGSVYTSLKRKTHPRVPEASSRHPAAPKLTEMLLSPVRAETNGQSMLKVNVNSPLHDYFKKTFSLNRGSPRHLRTDRLRQSSLPSSSTPVKSADFAKNMDTTVMKEDAASFLDSAFDDSFMNDAAMFESQILPVLEKVEAEALSQREPLSQLKCSLSQREPPSQLKRSLSQREPPSQLKCSLKEIEEKRQAAVQKRSLKLSQMTNGSK